jgi:large conductance mechanosensitive channel
MSTEPEGHKGSRLWKEFKDFVNRGNVIDLGVGIIIGGAFSSVVNSFVNDILTPPLGLLVSGSNLENWFYVIKQGKHPGMKYTSPAEAQADGAVTENVGHFLIQIINFCLVGITLFFIVTGANAIHREKVRVAEAKAAAGDSSAPTTRTCDWCKQTVPGSAVRCQFCTSNLNEKVPDTLKTPKTADASLINFEGQQ